MDASTHTPGATAATTGAQRRLKPLTIVPVWLLTLAAAVVIGVTSSGDDAYLWLPLALAGAVLVTFVLQLATSQKDGLVSRTMLSTGGSLVILALATLVVELA
ncbi:hypothetical protein [Frigoribacterium salinisoli]